MSAKTQPIRSGEQLGSNRRSAAQAPGARSPSTSGDVVEGVLSEGAPVPVDGAEDFVELVVMANDKADEITRLFSRQGLTGHRSHRFVFERCERNPEDQAVAALYPPGTPDDYRKRAHPSRHGHMEATRQGCRV